MSTLPPVGTRVTHALRYRLAGGPEVNHLPPVGTRVAVALYQRVEAGVIVEHAPSCAGPMLAWVLLDNGQLATANPRTLAQLA